ncbi:MAG: hypothetical protein N2515_09000 [Deltaproteobacteria bacterium]|nr:hypothetical protein [Sandaracinaceae bacterium]MCX7808733.1 hypothetical protein [Deltaproteobacteria bacterium]MDW8247461.1 hypothetical protein [Sandaracinaceae bacterium]
MALIDTDDAARRLARAIASDIYTYERENIAKELAEDRLFEAIAERLEEGRALFASRVHPSIAARGHFERALVDRLVFMLGDIPSPMW